MDRPLQEVCSFQSCRSYRLERNLLLDRSHQAKTIILKRLNVRDEDESWTRNHVMMIMVAVKAAL